MPFNEEVGMNQIAKQKRKFTWEIIRQTNLCITRRRVWNLKK